MKRLFIALLIAPPLAIFVAARVAASWKPQVVGVAPNAYQFQLSPDGRWLLATGSQRDDLIYPQQEVRLLDTTRQIEPRRFDAAFNEFSPDSRFLVSFNSKRRTLEILDLQSGAVERSWTGLTPQNYADGDGYETVSDVQFQNGGRELVAVTPFRIWRLDTQTGAKLSQTKIQIQYREAAGCGLMGGEFLLRDGRRLLYLNADEAWIYDARNGKRLGKSETGYLSPDEKTQYWWSDDTGEGWFGDFETGETLSSGGIGNPQFAGDGKTLVDVDAKLGVRLLDPRTGQSLRKLKVPMPEGSSHGGGPVYALAPDGNYWFALKDGKILRYRLR